MDILKFILQILAVVLGSLTSLLSILLLLRLRWPAPALWFAKLYASAWSPVMVMMGVLVTAVGLITGSDFISVLGTYVVLIYLAHIYRVTRPPDFSTGFEQAFGWKWEDSIAPEQKNHFLTRRTALRLPKVSSPRFKQNIPFARIPGTDRQLLCDVWLPPESVSPSGLAFIYLFGSAWYILDKDLGTRPFFRHLASQGHVIMDVAYRLSPETDLIGMTNDAKRAIAWMKENASAYAVNPDRIVIGGGSAGAHIAMMAAFTAGNEQFTPPELFGKNLSVCSVVSMYGPVDLEPMYYHTNQHLTTRLTDGKPKKEAPTEMPTWIRKMMGNEYYRLHFDKGFANAGTFAALFGCHPDECPDTYTKFSPINYVHTQCPPALLIHGTPDVMVPVKTTQALFSCLVRQKVPTVMHLIPQADHAFDLIVPEISPSAHNAIYDVERFLGLMANNAERQKPVAKEMEEMQLND